MQPYTHFALISKTLDLEREGGERKEANLED
jgi:hypothetical protein